MNQRFPDYDISMIIGLDQLQNFDDWIRNDDPETDEKLLKLFEEWTEDYKNTEKFVNTLPSSLEFLKCVPHHLNFGNVCYRITWIFEM